MAFHLGARVSFDSQYGRQLGTSGNYNRKTITMLGDDGRQWRISPQRPSPVKHTDTSQPSTSKNTRRLQ